MNEDLSGLTLIELLDLLEPVPEPAPVSLTPQTAGWIWLALALLAMMVWLVRRWLISHRANAYRRSALSAIEAAHGDPVEIARVLRRTALSAYPRRTVAGLHGPDWLAFLDRAYGGTGFRQGPGRVIATAPYRSSNPAPGLPALASEWIRQHRSDLAVP